MAQLYIISSECKELTCMSEPLSYFARRATCSYQLIWVYAMDRASGGVSHDQAASESLIVIILINVPYCSSRLTIKKSTKCTKSYLLVNTLPIRPFTEGMAGPRESDNMLICLCLSVHRSFRSGAPLQSTRLPGCDVSHVQQGSHTELNYIKM